MIFLADWFVPFVCILMPLYWLPWGPQARKWLLLVSCVIFHNHFAGPAGVLPIVALAVATYFIGLSRQRWLCMAGIVLSVAALVFYKYTRFLCQAVVGSIVPDWGESTWSLAHGWLPDAPPLAISFFAFEFVHYLIEVSRGHEPIRSPLDFSLFAIFWPTIVAGPVKRYQQFLPDMEFGIRNVSTNDVMIGTLRIASGLLKKFSADNITAWINDYHNRFDQLPMKMRWLFLAALAARILLDFSGYSDMAIGYARMMGIALPENFRYPYLSRSPADFWRRWHISLSTWIRDYVYIPLGGKRHGPVRKAANGLTAFLLCGLWHGATWNCVFWGLYHGAGLALTSNAKSLFGPVGVRLEAFFTRFWPLAWLLNMLFVCVGWVFFFYPMDEACRILKLLVFKHG